MFITISGTRATDRNERDLYTNTLGTVLRPQIQAGAYFYVGGARGIDTIALRYLISQGVAHRTTIVVPARVINQPRDAQRTIYEAISHGAKLVELERPDFPSASAYHARNIYMLQHSHYLDAFPLMGSEEKGGTWQGIHWAMKRDMPRTVVPVPGGADLQAQPPLEQRA